MDLALLCGILWEIWLDAVRGIPSLLAPFLQPFVGTFIGVLSALLIARYQINKERETALDSQKQQLAVALHSVYLELRDNRNTLDQLQQLVTQRDSSRFDYWELAIAIARSIADEQYRYLLSVPGVGLLHKSVVQELYASYSMTLGARNATETGYAEHRLAYSLSADRARANAVWTNYGKLVQTALDHLKYSVKLVCAHSRLVDDGIVGKPLG